ncbi:MAG: metallophosphoesterase [archaeon]
MAEKKLRILAAADLHGNLDIAERLSQKARKEKVDLVVLAGDLNGTMQGDGSILEPFVRANQKVLFVPGNWENETEEMLLKTRGKSIDNYYVSYGDVGIAGIGSRNWKFSLDEGDFEKIKRNFLRMKPSKKVLVSHLHAKDLKFERFGFYGDEVLRRAVEDVQPDLLISAHIHEIEGMEDKIGKTRVVQVGRKGTVLEI